jgi:excinuclease UvrABC ATPase subunit
VGAGTPEQISALKQSYTGQFLRKVLFGSGAGLDRKNP